MTTFYIVRHGETIWNVKKIVHGHSDAPLTKRGLQQATTIQKKLSQIHFDAIFSSDLGRAKTTAKIIAKQGKSKIITDKLLRERYFGVFEKLPFKDMVTKNKAIFQKLDKLSKRERLDIKFSKDMESDKEIAGRLLQFIKKESTKNLNKNFLVVSHGGPMKAILAQLRYLPYQEIYKRRFKNTGYIKIITNAGKIKIESVVNFDKFKVRGK